MPVIRRGPEKIPAPKHPQLVADLAAELANPSQPVQPLAEEFHFRGSDAVRVTVVWDRWAKLESEDRTYAILAAYSQARGEEFADRISLAISMTFPEAAHSGMLPFEVLPLARAGDPVALDECRAAMLELGASRLFGRARPRLLCATHEQAADCVARLVRALPASEPFWDIREQVPERES